jgi:heterodisulfide reductase subunit A2
MNRTNTQEQIRIGVYVCKCGLNIAATVDCEAVAAYAEGLDDVVVACSSAYLCSEPGQQLIKNDIAEKGVNRVVIGSCTPRLHEPTFRKCLADAGLNPYLLDMANLREQCSWVHADDPKAATAKARDLIRAGVARARLLQQRSETTVPVTNKALVIGGGVAGIQAALDLADSGCKVVLVEKQPSIGGIMARLDKTFPTLDCSI